MDEYTNSVAHMLEVLFGLDGMVAYELVAEESLMGVYFMTGESPADAAGYIYADWLSM